MTTAEGILFSGGFGKKGQGERTGRGAETQRVDRMTSQSLGPGRPEVSDREEWRTRVKMFRQGLQNEAPW